MPPLDIPLSVALALLAAAAGLTDLRYRRIPNWLVVSGLAAGFLMQSIQSGTAGVKSALLGAGLAFAIYVPLYWIRAMGGGDLKLMVAAGSITGPSVWFILFVLASLLGGVAAIVMVLWQGRLGRTVSNLGLMIVELLHLRAPHRASPELDVRSDQGASLPHGVVVAVSVGLYLFALYAPARR